MRVTFLGTAGSWPTKERSASAIALDTEKELLLLDCGEGTQRQFFQSSASFMRVRRVLLTHFHGDHFLGLPGLIQSMCLNNRTEPLDIYGPEDTKEMIDRVLKLGYFTLRFPIEVHALGPGALRRTERLHRPDRPRGPPGPVARLPNRRRHQARPVRRRPRAIARDPGRRFRQARGGRSGPGRRERSSTPSDVMGPPRPGRSIVYSGDSAPSEEIRKLADRATLLVHEATTAQDLELEANKWGHSSARQAAELAREAQVGTLYPHALLLPLQGDATRSGTRPGRSSARATPRRTSWTT